MKSVGRQSAPQEAVDRLVAEVVHQVDGYASLLYLTAPDRSVLCLEVAAGLPSPLLVSWQRLSRSAPLPINDAIRERRLVWVGSGEQMARRYPRTALAVPYHFALAAVPVLDGDAVRGALLLMWSGRHPEQLTFRQRSRLHTTAAALARQLRQAAAAGHPLQPCGQPRLVNEPAPRIAPEQAQAAAGFTERLPEGCCALDLDGRLTFLTRTAAELVGQDTDRLLGALPWEALPWLRDPVFEDRYRSALVSRLPTAFTALRPPDTWLTFQLYPDSTGISLRITPTLAPRFSTPETPAGSPALLTGSAASPEAAAPPTEPVRAGSLYRLLNLAGALTEAIGVRDVVDLVADQILPTFDAQALALLAIEAGRLRVIGHRGYPPEIIDRFHGAPLLPSGSPAMLPTDDRPAFFSSRAELNRAHPYLVHLDDGMASWALLPLLASGRRLGTCVLAYQQPHHFTADERTLLTALSGLIAQALDRARLYDAKHQLAHGLQAALLPRTLPRLSGLEVAARYLPATRGIDVGGDFYDLLRLNPTTAGAVIADVQGHNVTAAALMGQVRTAIHAHTGATPDQVLARTNRLLCDLDPDLFTSCLYAHLNLTYHHALLANAGHPPPLLRHPDGRTEILDLPTGLLLGIDPAARYHTTRVPLSPGTLLVLYTDGLVESPRTDLTEATDRLATLVATTGHRPLDELAGILLDHAPSHHGHTDDIALLLLRSTAPAPVQDIPPPPTGP